MSGQYQKGIGFWGILVLAPMVGLTLLMGIKLLPIFIEQASVKEVLETMSRDAEGFSTPSEVRISFMKRMSVNNIEGVTAEDITVERDGSFYDVAVEYESRKEMFYGVSLVVAFSKTVKVPAL